ncbi:hypothetical protein [Jeotgalibacillus proteolyticus]|uniref:Uncharacterized protein n=1 Tax=Jeotgalibacillus proteolyticus TaxID=2082395 RepID=A0A2S5GBL4_9BACL|nr:hypothetical protein [Jeotgalibacillus proteolyticus]PPA70304.1 hypothetical protein C4B60_12050 [Jeotgalibacillus proteolyticus]
MKDQEFLLTVHYLDEKYSVKGTPYVIEHHVKKLLQDLQEEKGEVQTDKELKIQLNTYSPAKNEPSDKFEEEAEAKKLKALLDDVEPTSEWLVVLTFIYFLTHYQKELLVTAKAISGLYLTSSLTPPGNVHLSIFQCVNKGFLQLIGTSDSQQTYEITSLGTKHIDDRISYSQKSRKEDSEIYYETEEQKSKVEKFLQEISSVEYEKIKKTKNFEDQVLLIIYYLLKKGISKQIRALMIYQILVHLNCYKGAPRSVQTTLSRARPLVKKVKLNNKIYYKLTEEGKNHIEVRVLKAK